MRISVITLSGVLSKCMVMYPQEACGVVTMRKGGFGELRSYGLRNVSDNPGMTFSADQQEQLELWEFLDKAGEAPVIAYHSHTRKGTEPFPSRSDIESHDPDLMMMIVGLSDPTSPVIKLWKITNGAAAEFPITVTT